MKMYIYLLILLIFSMFFILVNSIIEPEGFQQMRLLKAKQRSSKVNDIMGGGEDRGGPVVVAGEGRAVRAGEDRGSVPVDVNRGGGVEVTSSRDLDGYFDRTKNKKEVAITDEEEIIYTGAEYGIYFLEAGHIELYGEYWLDFTKTPSKLLRKPEHADLFAKEGCCLWERDGMYEVVLGTSLYKKIGYKKFKKRDSKPD